MYSLDVREFVSNGAVLLTILQFLSGILVCKQYVKNSSTADTSPLPFIFGLLSTVFWILYGTVKPDNKIIFVNIIGALLMSAYIVVFYIYTLRKAIFVKKILAAGLSLFCLFAYVNMLKDNDLLLSRLGLLACSLTLLTVAAPLSKFFYVLKVRCTNCLPFPMILMSFFVSATWFFYGIIEEDVYITTPNIIGGSLAALQLCLFLIFPHKEKAQSSPSHILA